MQPHKPFYRKTGDARDAVELREIGSKDAVDNYRSYFRGEISMDELHSLFLDNLKYVLTEVEILIQNIDANHVAVTADHSQALGERFLWDHRTGVQHPTIREVPWVKTTAEDTGSLSPAKYKPVEQTESSLHKQLQALGYR